MPLTPRAVRPTGLTTDSGTRIDRVTWGLDRVDQRDLPLNNVYDYGAMDGAAARVYILDTGVRISHVDFGGRAVSGYSVGCPTAGASSCGSEWLFGGVITEATSSCEAHGTHCASTAAGSDKRNASGVAKAGTAFSTATIVPARTYGLLVLVVFAQDNVTTSASMCGMM